ncbi:MAG: hypothetical protein Kow00124_04670 [Anaerolineae bacterium]
MPTTVAEVFAEIPKRFDPDAWGSEDAVLAFDVAGEGGGKWTARVAGGGVTINEGAAEDADMTMFVSSEDLLAIVNGELNAVSAFMQGKVRVDGNMALAMKLQGLLGL